MFNLNNTVEKTNKQNINSHRIIDAVTYEVLIFIRWLVRHFELQIKF